MKRYLLAVLIMACILFSGCGITEKVKADDVPEQSAASVVRKNTMGQQPNNISEFSPEDANAVGIMLDMEKVEVEKILGVPLKTQSHFEGAFGGDVLTYFYDFGTVRLEPLEADKYTVASININKSGFSGPRDTKIGNKAEEVLKRFPFENDANDFVYGKEGQNCGFLTYENGKIKRITYQYGSGFGSYTLIFEVDSDKIKSIAIHVINV